MPNVFATISNNSNTLYGWKKWIISKNIPKINKSAIIKRVFILNFDNNPSVVKAKKAKKCKNLSMRPEVNIELLKVSTDRMLKKINKILKLKKLNRKKKIGIVINLIWYFF